MSENYNAKTLKSGIWYTIATFLQKGVGFLTTPIFTRMLTQEEFGAFNNFTSWLSIFIVVCALNLGTTLVSAKYDYADKLDKYITSITVLGCISVLCWAILFNIFNSFTSSVFNMSRTYVNCMMLYILFSIPIEIVQAKAQFSFKYKITVTISLLLTVGSSLLSVLLVVVLPDRLLGRVIGYVAVGIVLGLVLLVYILIKGKKIEVSCWKYALKIALPYIPHLLSLTILNSIDRIMIVDMIGEKANALYSLAYTCGALVTILITCMNGAYSPWLGEKLHNKEYSDIRKISTKYCFGFMYFAVILILIAPEILLILGGESYSEAVYVIPPVAMGFVCQFIYTMYVNIEQYEKKTIGMAFASIAAAVLNFVLNLIFIPKFGYVAAAYTTFVGFLFLMFIHMLLVRKMNLHVVYNNKLNILLVTLLCGIAVAANYLYMANILRYIILGAYIGIGIVVAIVFRKQFVKMLKIILKK